VPLNAVSIPSRIHLDGYPDNPSMDYPDVSIPVPKSANVSTDGTTYASPSMSVATTCP